MWPVKRVCRFGRDERGNISVLALSLMVAMISIGGLALDTMRYEQKRVLVQNALDRCTLMAASLKQRLSPSDVVYDCMANANLRSAVKSVSVTDNGTSNGGASNRTVDAVAETDINALFPNVIGMQTLNVDARSVATQKLAKIEISLVLDVSSSMVGTKLTNLKTAAKEFVATVLNNDTDKRISINLVPFSTQVNLGAALRGLYNATYVHGQANVNCFDMPDSVYSSLSMSRTLAMPMTGNVDAFTPTSTGNSYDSPLDPSWSLPRTYTMTLLANMVRGDNRTCPALAGNVVRVGQQNISSLQTQIDGLIAAGSTGVQTGLRWGLALLDPGSQSVFTSLIGSSVVPSNLAGRPLSYTEPDVMKIIVVMSDGNNASDYRLTDNYRTGLSPIYKAPDGNYSIFHAAQTSANKYYVPHLGTWRATPYVPSSGSAVQQTWPQVWAAMRMNYVVKQFYFRAFPTDPAYSITNMMNTMRTITPPTSADTQQAAMCNLAKGQKVIIYSIAFEAPSSGKTKLSACASSPAHFFDASGTQISSAFRMIATNITQLKLTQ
jgi:hypothetical protein